jgi:gamma-glutamylcyclotransferase (GGCT)/AIG2-like uncharacterized protein YtfP
MTLDCRLLFVYGTLLRRSTHAMARYLAARASFVCEAKILGRLYNLGRFPGLVEAAGADWVFGELFDLGDKSEITIAELDRYEEAELSPTALFERRLAHVVRDDGTEVEAWVYWFRGLVDERDRIPSGRYL